MPEKRNWMRSKPPALDVQRAVFDVLCIGNGSFSKPALFGELLLFLNK
jgi:hypothetical protein